MNDDLDTSKYAFTSESPYTFTFESPTVNEATFHFTDKSYTLPAVEHKQYDPLASLCAVVIELHNRIQVLEAELKGQDDE